MISLKRSGAALAATFLIGLPMARTISAQASEITIKARHQERESGRIYATGEVEILYKTVRLFADTVELDPETKDVYASGAVTIHLPDEVISAESIRFNLDSRLGTAEKVFGMLQPSVFYRADSLERENDSLYRFLKARVTSCTQPVPRWRFTCSRADFRRDDSIAMWNSVFRIKNIPVFYLPYMRYPLDEERSTGFLIPEIGYNALKGFTYTQSFFWAIRRNLDATINTDYYSSRGLGAGLEFRYLLPRDVGGQANLFFFHFKNPEEQEIEPDAYIIRLKHSQPLPLNTRLVADVDYQSSFDFLREFDNNFLRALVSNRRSQVYLSRSWSSFNLNAQVSRFETYFSQLKRSIIRNTLPSLSFNSSKVKLADPIYFSFASSFQSWEYGWDNAYEAGTQKKSREFKLSPSLSIPFTSIPWLTVNSTVSANLAYYFNSYAPGSNTVTSEPLLSRNYRLNFELLGPVIYRIYYDGKGEPRLKHIIEPNLVYQYDSPVNTSDRIITTTFFYLQHYIKYGLTNRFMVRRNGMPREIFTLGIEQSYYPDPDNSPLQIYKYEGETPSYSDLRTYLRFYPSRRYSIDVSTSYNQYSKALSQVRLSANLGLPQDDRFLRVSWYKSTNPYYEGLLDRHQISLSGGAVIPTLGLDFRGDFDFNIEEKELLYSALNLTYHYQCLDFKFDFRVFYYRDKPEVQFGFSFGLGNIGKSTKFLGGMDF